jgi:hypothetical protein
MTTDNLATRDGTTDLMVQEELKEIIAQRALAEMSNEKAMTPIISIRGKKFKLDGDNLGSTLDVVVLASIYENAWWDRPYNPDETSPPACFAINEQDSDLAPHPTSPVPQAASCAICPRNEWGSGAGAGKACKNGRKLLVVAAETTGSVDIDTMVTLKLPPTSLQNWAAYAKGLIRRRQLPTAAVITTFTFDDDKDYPVLQPTFNSELPKSAQLAILKNKQAYVDQLLEPFDVSSYVPYDAAPIEAASTSRKSKMS